MHIDRCRRQSIADNKHKLARAARQRALRVGVQHAAEVGTAQIVAPVRRAARHLDGIEVKRAERGDQGFGIEGGVDGIAGPRMIEREVEQRLRRQAGAGAAKRDARRGQRPEVADRAW